MTAPSPTDGGRRPGRPRDEEISARVLQATLEILTESGLDGLRADLVAQRAGVPKSTIYRRWPSMTRLAVDAVERAVGPRPFEPSGDPVADVRRLVGLVHESLVVNPVGRALPRIAFELMRRPEAAQDYRDRLIRPLRAAAIDAVGRGAATGAWADGDAELAVDMVIGAIIYRLTFLDEPPTLEECLRAVDLLVRDRPDAG
jgi:AcrR family transcriptional regulator